MRISYAELDAAAGALGALAGRGQHLVVELLPPGRADLAAVDALARLALAARRSGGRLEVRADDGLASLVRLAGLQEQLSVEPGRQPDLGEDLGTEEVVDVGDPAG